MFQHTAARRRLQNLKAKRMKKILVSTHSRAEAAAVWDGTKYTADSVSTHSRAEAAAIGQGVFLHNTQVSTHSRAEAAAWQQIDVLITDNKLFQHTAARRRLRITGEATKGSDVVSTHSRAEAAAISQRRKRVDLSLCFNTQPRGGGC